MTLTRFKSVLLFTFLAFTYSANALTLGTWNIAFLDDTSARASSQRTTGDYRKLNDYFLRTGIDVLGFQEVANARSLSLVIGEGYNVEMSERAIAGNMDPTSQWKQFTGFAIRKGIDYMRHADLVLDVNRNNRLRNGVDISLYPEGMPELRVLVLHLKSKCFDNTSNDAVSCKTWKTQVPIVNQWISDRQQAGDEYIVIGDLNRRLIKTGFNYLSGVTFVNPSATSKCISGIKSNGRPIVYKDYIDHILVPAYSQKLAFTQYKQTVFSKNDVERYNLSDHCPLSVSIKLK